MERQLVLVAWKRLLLIVVLFIWNRRGAHWPASHSNLVLSYFSPYLFLCSFESYCSSPRAIANPMKIQWSATETEDEDCIKAALEHVKDGMQLAWAFRG